MTIPVMVRRYPPPETGDLVVLYPTIPFGSSPYTCPAVLRGEIVELDPFEVLNQTAQARAGEADVDALLAELRRGTEGGAELVVYKRFDRRWIEVRKAEIEARKDSELFRRRYLEAIGSELDREALRAEKEARKDCAFFYKPPEPSSEGGEA